MTSLCSSRDGQGKKFVIYDNAIPVRSVALVDVMFYPRGQVERDIIRDKGD